jgi:hypothetical protein
MSPMPPIPPPALPPEPFLGASATAAILGAIAAWDGANNFVFDMISDYYSGQADAERDDLLPGG